MTIAPRFGEIWHAPNGTVMPGGMLCLIVSADDYNRYHGRYVIVEVVDAPLSGDALICDLGDIGVALTGSPFTVDASWFDGATDSTQIVSAEAATRAADQIRAILGP